MKLINSFYVPLIITEYAQIKIYCFLIILKVFLNYEIIRLTRFNQYLLLVNLPFSNYDFYSLQKCLQFF